MKIIAVLFFIFSSYLIKAQTNELNYKEKYHQLLFDYDSLASETSFINKELKAELEKIKNINEQAKNRDKVITKLKDENAILREIMKNYIHVIDSLTKITQTH